MKKYILLCLLAITTSCSKDKHVVEKQEIIGTWKEMQRKPSRNTPVIDATDCKVNKVGAEIFSFNSDGSYTVKNICTNELDSEGNIWSYEDNILNLKDTDKNGKYQKIRYSVTDQGNNRLKFSLVFYESESGNLDLYGYYSIMEK